LEAKGVEKKKSKEGDGIRDAEKKVPLGIF